MIANTVKTLRYCRSQPFSKCAPETLLSHNVQQPPAPPSNTFDGISPQGPDSPQAGKNHSDVRAYVRQFNVIDNQRTLTQLSHGLEHPRSWKPLRDRKKKKLMMLHQGMTHTSNGRRRSPVVDHPLAWPGDPFTTVIWGVSPTAAAHTATL